MIWFIIFSRIKWENEGKQNETDNSGNHNHRKACLDIIIERIPTWGKDHHIGRHPDRSGKSKGRSNDGSDDNGLGIRPIPAEILRLIGTRRAVVAKLLIKFVMRVARRKTTTSRAKGDALGPKALMTVSAIILPAPVF